VEELNVIASWDIARQAKLHHSHIIYISTDYMFDGTGAPYKETAVPNPLNEYGRLKLRGEWAVLAANSRSVILRVPLLFGPCTDLAESACTAFAAVAKNSATKASVDDWQIRVPTYTVDIAATLVNMSKALVAAEPVVGHRAGPVEGLQWAEAEAHRKLVAAGESLRGIYNYTSADRYTRYELVRLFARLQDLEEGVRHVTRTEGMPPGAPRPYDCHLDDSKIRATGLAAPNTPFEVAAAAVLRGVPA
jgi:dTDP-4-dehydrorhamnose reductase